MTASVYVSLVGAPHLSAELLAHLRSMLLDESRALAAQSAEREATLSQLTGNIDMEGLLERELAEAGAARAREAIDDIDHALERLALGTYGYCEACGVPIAFERLEAVPAARHCVSCSRRRGGLLR
jgi:DnaK suppressor protein